MPRKPTVEEIMSKMWIPPRDLGILVGVSVKTIYNRLSSGDMFIPYTKFGRGVRFKLQDVLAYLEKNEVRPEAD